MVAGTAVAVNVAACPMIGDMGSTLNDTVAGPATDTVTLRCAVAVIPPASVTINVTTYRPPVLNACVTI